MDSRAHVGIVSFPEVEEEGWLGRLRKLGSLGSRDFPALAMLPGEMWCIKRAVGAATGIAGWIGSVTERGPVLRVATRRPVLPGLRGARREG